MHPYQEDPHHATKHLLNLEVNTNSSLANAPGLHPYSRVAYLPPPLHRNSEVNQPTLNGTGQSSVRLIRLYDDILDQQPKRG
jgi:hypothetical protein